jgi:alcohol dehydrogenase class IV
MPQSGSAPGPLAFVFSSPTKIVYGEGVSADAGLEMSALGSRRPLLVTDAGVRAAGLVDGVLKALGKSCAGVFDEVPQDSGVHVVEKAAELARSAGADGVVSLGGGSVLDTAKGLALLLTEGGRLADYQGFQMLSRRQAIHVAIPTTAGTGSEATFAALIKDHQSHSKVLLFDAHLAPDVAILDPRLLASLPPRITAFTGMDALTHAVESLHSLQAEPFSDALALHAVRLIAGNLPACVERGRDLEARGRMLVAATLAGQAFTNAMVGVVHALAHTLGGRFGVPHGLANAILLPFGMEYNLRESAAHYARVAEAFGVRRAGLGEEQSARAAVQAVRELLVRLGLPSKLREAGVPRAALSECGEAALSDGSIVYNPRPADAASLTELLEAAW